VFYRPVRRIASAQSGKKFFSGTPNSKRSEAASAAPPLVGLISLPPR